MMSIANLLGLDHHGATMTTAKQPRATPPNMTLGYLRDLPDHRDYRFVVPVPTQTPPTADLRGHMPPVYDQGGLGDCVANAVAALVQYNEIFQKKTWEWPPSRLFQYWNTRFLMGTTGYDSGSGVRDAITAAARWGVVDEALWPYDIAKFTSKPNDGVYMAASTHPIKRYERVASVLQDMRQCLASHHPIAAGMMVCQSFFAAPGGVVPMPSLSERPVGGHCVVLCGYDDSANRFMFRNSWGKGWGADGYGTLPYEYALDQGLCGDLWTIRSV